jgi:hypothetical protein
MFEPRISQEPIQLLSVLSMACFTIHFTHLLPLRLQSSCCHAGEDRTEASANEPVAALQRLLLRRRHSSGKALKLRGGYNL